MRILLGGAAATAAAGLLALGCVDDDSRVFARREGVASSPQVARASSGDDAGDVAKGAGDASTVASAPPPVFIIGRVDERDPAGPRLAWPGTQMRWCIRSPGKLRLDLADTGTSHYEVRINWGMPRMLTVNGPRRNYEIDFDGMVGVYDIVITKRSEASDGVTQVFGVDHSDFGAPCPPSIDSQVVTMFGSRSIADAPRIELVGDWSMCAPCAVASRGSCPFVPEMGNRIRAPAMMGDPHVAWTSLTALIMNTVHQATTIDGIGVTRNRDGSTTGTMPERYARSIPDDPSSPWNPSFAPDVVVVSLGANDFASGDPGLTFQTAYANFLATVRSLNAKAHLVAVTSQFLDEPARSQLRTYIESAVAARTAAGDARVTMLDVAARIETVAGCVAEPDSDANRLATRALSAKLTDHLSQVLGWKPVSNEY